MDMDSAPEGIVGKLLEAIQPHVPFDGWSEEAFRAAVSDAGLDLSAARAACPRGAVNLALAFHAAGDGEMVRRLGAMDLQSLRFRDRVAMAVRTRLELIEDKELVRRGATLFALPPYAADAARSLWGTASLIWDTLGDTSEDLNWYTKRATLSGVYSATVLFWLGDDSPGHQRTWVFLDRRIEDVMRIEKLKAQVNENPLGRLLMAGPNAVSAMVRRPKRPPEAGLPGNLADPI